jgi:hypothetical protein
MHVGGTTSNYPPISSEVGNIMKHEIKSAQSDSPSKPEYRRSIHLTMRLQAFETGHGEKSLIFLKKIYIRIAAKCFCSRNSLASRNMDGTRNETKTNSTRYKINIKQDFYKKQKTRINALRVMR